MKTQKAEMKSKLMKENMKGITKVFASDAKRTQKKGGVHLQPTRKMVRAKIRDMMFEERQSKKANQVASWASRKERREVDRMFDFDFEPNYNGQVFTYEEYHGVGVERFNNKFVKFD